MSTLRVSLLGRFRAQRDQQALTGLEASKVQELLCYLLLHRDRSHPRESLAALLWGDTPTAQSRKYLRQVLWQLQAALEAEGEAASDRVLLVEPDWVRIDSSAGLWLDVAEFERAFAPVHGVPGHQLEAQTACSLQHAVELYQGDLLDGWYQDWCIYERERLQNLHLAMLDRLMDYCEARRDYDGGLAHGERILRHDRARERTHRRLMRLLYLAGDRSGALRQYERCAAALKEELDVKPGKRTEALFQQIRADQLGDASPSSPQAAPPLDALPASLAEVLARLRRVQGVLAEVQRQVQQEIGAVEQALKGGQDGSTLPT